MTATRAARRAPSPLSGRLASAALLLSASFLLSRVLGVLRNAVIAGLFGTGRVADAYFAAFRIPDTMFLLVSGGALASAFVPVFAGLIEQKRDREAWIVASTVLNAVALAMAALAVIAFLFAPLIMDVLVGNYTPAERSQTVDLTRVMLIQPMFLGAAAIVSSVLQTYHRFLLTAIAPLVYNLVTVLGALLFGRAYGANAVVWSVVLGAVGYLLVQLPGVRGEWRRFYRWSLELGSPSVQEVLRLFAPRVVGLAAFQVMLFITLFLAQGLPEGNVAAINYAWLLISFPVGALGTAAATAIFPTLSRLSASRDDQAVRATVNRTVRLVLFLATPSAVGLIVLRRPIINLLYGHLHWSNQATEQTAFALIFYALALAPLAGIEVFPRVFYAMKDTVTPVRIAVVTVLIDAVLSVIFVHLVPRASGQGGLALATAVATTVQVVWLARALERRLGGIGLRSIALALRDTFLASGVMGLVLYVALDPLSGLFPQSGVGALLTVVIEVALGGATFLAVALLLGAPELRQARSFAGRGK